MIDQALVSCIMPTANRRTFVPWAIADFLRQDHPARELIVVDDGDDPVDDLMPGDERIVYVRLPARQTIGAKRNLACERAHGELIAHWDDDDWHAPHRLRAQVEALSDPRIGIVGIREPLYFEPATGRAWRYIYRGSGQWLAGNSLCYRRAVWERQPFADVDIGEDSRFVGAARQWRIADVADPSIHVGIVHASNVSPKRTRERSWVALDRSVIETAMGADIQRYQCGGRPPAASPPRPTSAPPPERTIPMLAVALESDLDQPEFVAYRTGHALPWMRRWELPFVLTKAELTDTMSVLDATVNPAGFELRLRQLYPHVGYRYWAPIHNGAYRPPLGIPDRAYDRVVCVNTLEHLPAALRAELVRDLAAKLAPGGRLLLTSDAYFDGMWSDRRFLDAGVVRADRTEFVGGFNRVGFRDWIELCAAVGLAPVDPTVAVPADPTDSDPGLYRNAQPFVHAAIGGVFGRPGDAAAAPARRRIVLALLTWNTRDVSLDSVAAYAREARMLRRLGHEVLVCVCDNGSDDGTADALRALDATLDVPHRFVFNTTNRGSSIARNQILDVVADWSGDYVLFMDGDIEIVPFSSFAMLRYLEAHGGRLGCIGASSSSYTNDRARATPAMFAIEPNRVSTTNIVAWTQYGMFRREVFEAGVRFDERRPFDGAGWGFEDNDLAFQMDVKGFANHFFAGITYLHRDARSSMRVMRAKGIDPRGLYDARKAYVIEKWAGIPQIANGPLHDVRRAFLP